jgi:hypothetical protein
MVTAMPWVTNGPGARWNNALQRVGPEGVRHRDVPNNGKCRRAWTSQRPDRLLANHQLNTKRLLKPIQDPVLRTRYCIASSRLVQYSG